MFGARVEQGKWRLCYRKNETIHYHDIEGHTEIVFKNQKIAKACADALNAQYWKEFDYARKNKQWPAADILYGMVDTINGFIK